MAFLNISNKKINAVFYSTLDLPEIHLQTVIDSNLPLLCVLADPVTRGF